MYQRDQIFIKKGVGGETLNEEALESHTNDNHVDINISIDLSLLLGFPQMK
jgi:hypothetical protein